VVVPTSGDVTMEDVEDLRPSKRKVIYIEVYQVINDAISFSASSI
jgi:hypothetical protein